jgi:hypothetical protein
MYSPYWLPNVSIIIFFFRHAQEIAQGEQDQINRTCQPVMQTGYGRAWLGW